MEGYNKFNSLLLFPASTLHVSVSPSAFRTKISWAQTRGSGRAGAQTLPPFASVTAAGGTREWAPSAWSPAALEKARALAAEIVAELKT